MVYRVLVRAYQNMLQMSEYGIMEELTLGLEVFLFPLSEQRTKVIQQINITPTVQLLPRKRDRGKESIRY